MKKFGITTLLVIILLNCSNILYAQMDSITKQYLFFPRDYELWDLRFTAGASVSHLPASVVEEEISYSPMILVNTRIGLPAGFAANFQFNSNYIANHGYISFQKSILNDKFSLAIGGKYAAWFGHLELESIRLKSWGWLLSPYITAGIDFDERLITAEIETQHSVMYTYSDDILLGIIKRPFSGAGIKISIEQPLWNGNWTVLALKLNYAKFYYQSWLSFTTVDEYLFYPELIFGFIL